MSTHRTDRHPLDGTAWCRVVSIIDGLIASGEYDWAFDPLTGMKQTIEATRRVTEAQQRAVANIERAGRGR